MMQGELTLMVLRNALYTRLMSGHTRLKSMVDLRYRSSNVHWGAESKKITAVNDILIKYSSLYTKFQLAKSYATQVQESRKLKKGMKISLYTCLS